MPFLLLYFKFIFKGNSYKKIISCRFNYHFSQLLRTSFNKNFCQKLSFFKKRIHRNTETPPQPKSTKHDALKAKKNFCDTYIFIWYPW